MYDGAVGVGVADGAGGGRDSDPRDEEGGVFGGEFGELGGGVGGGGGEGD